MCCTLMKPKLPAELGDAMLIAAGVIMLVLFAMLYVALPTTTVDVETAVRVVDQGQSGGQSR